MTLLSQLCKQHVCVPFLKILLVGVLCTGIITLTACTAYIPFLSMGASQCQNNCTVGTGVQGIEIYVEPNAGESVIVDAIQAAQKSVWLEMYLLSDRKVIRALQEAANHGIDVRVMLEPHPFGSPSPAKTLDELRAAGAMVQETSPAFSLTHEKGMIIDQSVAFIMTSNFTTSALGGSSKNNYVLNREYGIIDNNPQDVQAVTAIFLADWQRTTAQFNDPNLVVSPVNSRNDFTHFIQSAHSTLQIEAEELQDGSIEQALLYAAQHGVRVQLILPAPQGSSPDSNAPGIATLRHGSIEVHEDARLYMHAKIIVVDGRIAFVGSENMSAQSLDENRELGILVSDNSALNTLQTTFQQDWDTSQIA